MRVKQVTLTNFRNYGACQVDLQAGKTILIGANAQGKSNFLEAIEIASFGKSTRAAEDAELIRWGEDHMLMSVQLERGGFEQTVSLALRHASRHKQTGRAMEKQIKINGVIQGSAKSLLGRLVTVSFKSDDLNLLRLGPKCRRDWINEVAVRLRPAYQDMIGNFQKVVVQRNRLLKSLFERHRVTVNDQDQLLAWDKQLARYGAQIIKQRLQVLSELVPLATGHQQHLSAGRELLAADYLFRMPEARESDDDLAFAEAPSPEATAISAADINQAAEPEIASILLNLLKQRRREEIARKQTLVGPHRDDIAFRLNDTSAVSFASQGQQRSLVLALKLAELELIRQHLDEPPVLLLDDVLAELDLERQALLTSTVAEDMQTVITTTHVSSFDPKWLVGAEILQVSGGQVLNLDRAPT